jgi:hypothetical protein
MIKKITPYISLFLLLFVLFSCGDETPKEKTGLYKQLIINEEGIIRGVKINDNINQIKSKENETFLTDESANYLEYEYEINEEAFIVVAYHFDEKGCSEINIDTYFETVEQAKETLALYQEHFSKKYGKPEITDDLYLWYGNKKKMAVEVDFIDQEDGEIMLTIYANE